MLHEFERQDVFDNVIESNPRFYFLIHNKTIYFNNQINISGTYSSNILGVPSGYIDLYENNVNRRSSEYIYPYVIKNSSSDNLSSVTTSDYDSYMNGEVISGSYPMSSSISVDRKSVV